MDVVVTRTGAPGLAGWLRRWGGSWAAAIHEGERAGLDGASVQQPAELLADAARDDADRELVLAAAVEDGRVVGGALLELPLLDNPDLALVVLAVPPAERRRGVGAALLHEVADQAAARGRSTLLAEVRRPSSAGPASADRGWPGSRFAERAGLGRGLVDVRRDLDLPPDADRLASLAAQVAERARGYRVSTWAGPTPAVDRGRMAALMARMSTDAPLGDLRYEPEAWDADRVAAAEERAAAQGRERVTAVASAPDGEWTAFTVLTTSRWTPPRLEQWETLVLPEHRGRRLGLAVKLAALEAAAARWPRARCVGTWNATDNAPMVAVNEALGFRPVELLESWQGPVAGALRLSGRARAPQPQRPG